MYRLIPLILFTLSTAAAPQDGNNSDITYVKIQPVIESVLKKQTFRSSRIENIPLTIPGNVDRSEEVAIVTEDSTQVKDKGDEKDEIDIDNTQDNPRKARSDDSTTSYEETEPTESATEALEDVTKYAEDYESRTKAPAPRFLSKLSYFQKGEVKSSVATNLVERPGKRRFKSKCRCEKIWNCPKLQITVPRCPNEYFMCCF